MFMFPYLEINYTIESMDLEFRVKIPTKDSMNKVQADIADILSANGFTLNSSTRVVTSIII